MGHEETTMSSVLYEQTGRIVTITSVVLTSQSAFNKTLILANTAYDVALSLRSAATYGLGGHAINMMPTGYGMHFELSTPGSFTLFADTYPAPSALSVCHSVDDPSTLDAPPSTLCLRVRMLIRL